jgi:adenylosuccinate synthase
MRQNDANERRRIMKKVLAAALGILLLMEFPLIFAAQTSSNQETREISGVIKEVSANVGLVTIETPEEVDKTVSVEPQTEILVEGKQGTMGDLKKGQYVMAVVPKENSKAISLMVPQASLRG